MTKRRILLEVDVDDGEPGAMLAVINRLAEFLEKLREDNRIIKYGLDLVAPAYKVNKNYLTSIETMEVPEEG